MSYKSCTDHSQTRIINNYYTIAFPLTGSNYDVGGKNLTNVGTIEAVTFQQGTNTQFEDQQMVLNKDEGGTSSTITTWSGLEISRPSLTSYNIGFWEATDQFKCGIAGSELPILRCNLTASMTDAKYLTWDNSNEKAITSTYGDTEIGAIKTKTDYITISDTLTVSGASSLNQGVSTTSSPTFGGLELGTGSASFNTRSTIQDDGSNFVITCGAGAFIFKDSDTFVWEAPSGTELMRLDTSTGYAVGRPTTITSTTANQLTLAYDATYKAIFDVSSVGQLSITPNTGVNVKGTLYGEEQFRVYDSFYNDAHASSAYIYMSMATNVNGVIGAYNDAATQVPLNCESRFNVTNSVMTIGSGGLPSEAFLGLYVDSVPNFYTNISCDTSGYCNIVPSGNKTYITGELNCGQIVTSASSLYFTGNELMIQGDNGDGDASLWMSDATGYATLYASDTITLRGNNITLKDTNQTHAYLDCDTGGNVVIGAGALGATTTTFASTGITTTANLTVGNSTDQTLKIDGASNYATMYMSGPSLNINASNNANAWIYLTAGSSAGVIVYETLQVLDSDGVGSLNLAFDHDNQWGQISSYEGASKETAILTGLRCDQITEYTTDNGISIESCVLKDGGITLNSGATCNAILDEDAMGSDSATSLCTQQSIKSYVDNHSGVVAREYGRLYWGGSPISLNTDTTETTITNVTAGIYSGCTLNATNGSITVGTTAVYRVSGYICIECQTSGSKMCDLSLKYNSSYHDTYRFQIETTNADEGFSFSTIISLTANDVLTLTVSDPNTADDYRLLYLDFSVSQI